MDNFLEEYFYFSEAEDFTKKNISKFVNFVSFSEDVCSIDNFSLKPSISNSLDKINNDIKDMQFFSNIVNL